MIIDSYLLDFFLDFLGLLRFFDLKRDLNFLTLLRLVFLLSRLLCFLFLLALFFSFFAI